MLMGRVRRRCEPAPTRTSNFGIDKKQEPTHLNNTNSYFIVACVVSRLLLFMYNSCACLPVII